MERYAAGTRCRHRSLVEYFGQSYGRAECGACDWCLKELDAVADSRTLAQKILSCVARVKQTWGTAHVTDVLTGKATEKVVAAGHHDLSTFGLLKEEAPAAIRGYIEQLVGGGLLAREGDPYPVLRLTPAGAALLRGDGDCVAVSRGQAAVVAEAEPIGRARVVHGGGRFGSVRCAARGAPAPGARARRAALRDLPRHDAARHGRSGGRKRSTICTRSTASARRRRPTSATRSSTRFEHSGGRSERMRTSDAADQSLATGRSNDATRDLSVTSAISVVISERCRARAGRRARFRRRSGRRPR